MSSKQNFTGRAEQHRADLNDFWGSPRGLITAGVIALAVIGGFIFYLIGGLG